MNNKEALNAGRDGAATKGARLWPTAQPQRPEGGTGVGIVPRHSASPPAATGACARPPAHRRGPQNHRGARRFSPSVVQMPTLEPIVASFLGQLQLMRL